MISKLPPHLQSLVESICEDGCSDVNAIINAMDEHQPVEKVSHLNSEEHEMVLNALKNIMSVYDN